MLITPQVIGNKSRLTRTALVIATLAMAGCTSSDNNDANTSDNTDTMQPDDGNSTQLGNNSQVLAFIASDTALRDAGQIERLSISDGYISTGTYPATLSDIRVDTDGENVYQIGRFMIDTISRFDPIDTSAVDFQFSVNGEETASNPYDIAFANSNKAYVVRRGSSKVWIINPDATIEDDFKIGELDLSAYDTDSPEPTAATIVGNKLFILMERLTGFDPDKSGYVAVFDTLTDEEIDTGKGSNGLKGIKLSTINPTNLQYDKQTNMLYITGRGNLFVEFNSLPGDPYQGGVEAINSDSYEPTMLIDDGTMDNNQGFFSDAIVVTDQRGYIITYSGSDPVTFAPINELRSFNPVTGVLDANPIAAVTGLEVANLSMGPEGNVWIGVRGDTPGFVIVNPVDNSVVKQLVPTQFNPLNVVFITTTP